MKERIDDHKDGTIRARGHTRTTSWPAIGNGSEKTAQNCGQGSSRMESKLANGPPTMPEGPHIRLRKWSP